jgi:phosphoribosylamine--glycine ligase
MRILVIGSGGREHALCWAIAASPLLSKLWCAPGNPGIATDAERVPIAATDIAGLVAFAREHEVDLVVPGPEQPLVAGITDAMAAAGIACCGPSAAAAALEGSKSFAKEICDAAAIPTARWERFDDPEAARTFIRRRGAPIVVKADGLAGGKGVVVAPTEALALAAIERMMGERVFGAAGAAIVIEECLIGEELSFFALCDGTHALSLGSAQDHKRVRDGDTGPNTGGMGAISPAPSMTPALEQAVMDGIIRPVLVELTRRGMPFRGILYAGLMLTETGPKVIEFNVRFGDPECQALMPRLMSDLVPALLASRDGMLKSFDLRWHQQAALTVVMAARGYPGRYDKGSVIEGLDDAAAVEGVEIFHAGTKAQSGRVIADGGRVLSVSALGRTVSEARTRAYEAVSRIRWPQGFYRRDIGWRAVERERNRN